MNTKPKKQTTGATLILRTLKMSGSKVVSVVPGPAIKTKPMTTMHIPIANKAKLVLPKANFLLSILIILFDSPYYILYNALADIRKYLPTDTYAQKKVRAMPNTITTKETNNIVPGVIMSIKEGSYVTKL